MKIYIVYVVVAILLICTLFYMRDDISLWLSTVGTYVVISAVTFFLGWLLGYWGMRNRYKRRIKELQASHVAALEQQKAELTAPVLQPESVAESKAQPVISEAEQAALQK